MFHSRDPHFRKPTGAVPVGESIHFRITLPRSLSCHAAYLIVKFPDDSVHHSDLFWCGMNGADREWWECDFAPEKDGLYFYHFELKTQHGRSYLFRGPGAAAILDGSHFDGSGNYNEFNHSNLWQITVYRSDFTTPDWLSGGILYQIFPDRFFSSKRRDCEAPPVSGAVPHPSALPPSRPLNSGDSAAEASHPSEASPPPDPCPREEASSRAQTAMTAYRQIHAKWHEPPQWQPNAQGEITNEDFFGGDLRGIRQKLPYLKSLGVSCLYLNPIFHARSNHRYDTGNYEEIDPFLGTAADFTRLCAAAKEEGIRIILDGVFSHTGSDSLYFNKEGRYPALGAYQDQASPYYPWYQFHHWPDDYESWWGFRTLPNVNECSPSYLRYITGGEGIVRKWLRAGASGWRLDVADELPDAFLDQLRQSVKTEDPNGVILGEVWEDASTKTAYGIRRRYLQGEQLDTVMNYPFRDAILQFLRHGAAQYFFETIETILEHYPPQCIRLLMNHIGTHDTERAITMLAGDPTENRDRTWQSAQKLSPAQYALGVHRMKLASLIQYTLPGVPCIYYGDEAGMQGYRDPFNRGTYPWGRENQSLLSWYQGLGRLRKHPVLSSGISFRRVPLSPALSPDTIAYERYRILPQEDPPADSALSSPSPPPAVPSEKTEASPCVTEEILLILIHRGESPQLLPEDLIPVRARCLLGEDLRDYGCTLTPHGCAVYEYQRPQAIY